MQESKLSKIDIKDVQQDVLLTMLKFMYTTQLEPNDIDDVDLLSLTILADRFDIPLLQSASNSKLVEEISEVFDFVELLLLSTTYHKLCLVENTKFKAKHLKIQIEH